MTEIEYFTLKGDLNGLENVLKNSSINSINKKEPGLWHSALATAVLMEKVESVELLLKYGANPNSLDKKGKTPLFYVGEEQPIEHDSAEKRKQIAQMLLVYNADINICDIIKNQALFYVVFHVRGKDENLPLVELLLKYGANPNHKNVAGNSPLDFAKKVNNKKLIDILESYIKK